MPSEPARYGTARYGVARYSSASAIPAPRAPFPNPKTTKPQAMTDTLTNQTNMIDTAIKLAKSATHRPVWENQAPLAFGIDLTALEAALADALELATAAYSATSGTTDQKAVAEDALEDLAYAVARALANHFKKTGDLEKRAKVNVRKSAIVRLRDTALTTRCTEIRDLAQAAVGTPGAADRGITAPRVTALTAAITEFERLRNSPRSAVADRSAMRRELKTVVAGLMQDIADLDDLILQFPDSTATRTFIAAWKQARIIVDAGHGPGEEEPPANPPTP